MTATPRSPWTKEWEEGGRRSPSVNPLSIHRATLSCKSGLVDDDDRRLRGDTLAADGEAVAHLHLGWNQVYLDEIITLLGVSTDTSCGSRRLQPDEGRWLSMASVSWTASTRSVWTCPGGMGSGADPGWHRGHNRRWCLLSTVAAHRESCSVRLLPAWGVGVRRWM